MPTRPNLPSENSVWSILDALPIAIYVKDADCKFLYVNLQCAKNLGLAHQEGALGKTDADFFDINQARNWIAQEKRIMSSQEGMIDRKELEVWPGGRRRWVLTSKLPIRMQDGTICGLFGISKDITESERINLAVAGAREGLWYRSLNTSEVWYSPNWKEMLGYADEELPNTRDEFKSRVHPDDWPSVAEQCDGHVHGKVPYYECCFRMKHKNGTYRRIRSRGMVSRDEGGTPQVFAGSHADITDSFDREGFYLTVLDTIPNLIFVKGEDLRFVFVNRAVAENFDKPKDGRGGIIGKTDADVNRNSEQVRRFIEADQCVMAHKEPITIPEEVLTDSQGNERTLTTKKLPLVYPGKPGIHVLGVATDITDLKRTREYLKKTLLVLTSAVKDIETSESENDACALALLHLEHLGHHSVALSLLRENAGGRVLVTDSQYATGRFAQVAGRAHPRFDVPEKERDLLSAVLATNRSRFIFDPTFGTRPDAQLFSDCGVVSQYIVPVATGSLMIGTLQIDLGDQKEKPETECAMFDALGSHLSLAIERHRVLRALEIANTDLISQARMITFEAAAAKIIHELNRSISEYSKQLTDKIDSPEIRKNRAAFDFLKFTQRQIGQWVASVQENIMMVSKNEEEADYLIEDIVREAVGNFQYMAAIQHRRIRGIYEAPEATASIRHGSLLELLSCLILNSVEANARHVDVLVRHVKGSGTSGGLEEKVEIVVADDGDGIPDEYDSHLFSFGWSSKGKRGHGMGLAIIKILAKSMEGDISLRSRGRSAGEAKTEFVVWIPVNSV